MFKVKKGFTVIEIAIVVAIVAIIAGVWYVSKNKTGADIAMPGIGKNGTPPTGGVDPAKMGIGTIKGQVTNKDGTPANNVVVAIVGGKCGTVSGDGGSLYTGVTDKKGYYKVGGIPPGNYCVDASSIVNTKFSASYVSNITVKFGETKIHDIVLSYSHDYK